MTVGGRAESSSRTSAIYLPLLLFFILGNEVCNNYILNIFSIRFEKSHSFELLFYCIFLLFQIFFSPIQSGYSDFYCRKKSLVVALGCSALSLIPLFFYFETAPLIILLIMTTAVKGIVGNILPLSWAGIADTQSRNVRVSLGLSTSAIALGYLSFIAMTHTLSQQYFLVVLFLGLLALMLLCIWKFSDLRDRTAPHFSDVRGALADEVRSIVRDFLGCAYVRSGLLTFILWEFSFYTAHILDVDLRLTAFGGLTLTMVLGYLTGVCFLPLVKQKTDEAVIKIGYIVSIIPLTAVITLVWFVSNIKYIIFPCYFVYALGAAFLAPSMLSILSKIRKPYEQGKIYGLLDSSDTIAFLAASVIDIIYSWTKLNHISIITISCAAFVLSLIPYEKFKKSIVGRQEL